METPPARDFLDECPEAVRDELLATVLAVRNYPPPSFPTSTPRWTVMTETMGGVYEARDKLGKELYRLFCLLDRQAHQHGASAPLLVLLGGANKPVRTAMPNDVYEEIRLFRGHYLSTNPRPIDQ